jgi:hypothetical protein
MISRAVLAMVTPIVVRTVIFDSTTPGTQQGASYTMNPIPQAKKAKSNLRSPALDAAAE